MAFDALTDLLQVVRHHCDHYHVLHTSLLDPIGPSEVL